MLELFSLEKRKHRKILLMEGGKAEGPRIFPVSPLPNKRKWSNFRTKKVASEHREALFLQRPRKILEEVVQRGCKISIPIHIQNPNRHRPEQTSI